MLPEEHLGRILLPAECGVNRVLTAITANYHNVLLAASRRAPGRLRRPAAFIIALHEIDMLLALRHSRTLEQLILFVRERIFARPAINYGQEIVQPVLAWIERQRLPVFSR